MRLTRRDLTRLTVASLAGTTLTAPFGAVRAADQPEGEIAFIRGGDVWRWSSQDDTKRILEDGNAMDPVYDPVGSYILYVRDGGSYTNLVLANPANQRTREITDNESSLQPGSEDYVADSIWLIDPAWSESGLVVYASDEEVEEKSMQLWIFDMGGQDPYLAASDGTDTGPIEHTSIDSAGKWVTYTTMLADNSGASTSINLRDLDLGTTYPLPFGGYGAFDSAISGDSQWIVASVRDDNGEPDLYLCHRETEEVLRLTEGERASGATWSRDGEWIAYIHYTGSSFAIRALKIDPTDGSRVGKAHTLVEADDIEATSGLSWHPIID